MCVSVTLITGSSVGVLRYLNYIPALAPFLFLVSLKKFRKALLYLAVYVVCEAGTATLVPYLPDAVNILFTGVIAFSTRLIPGTMMGWFLFSTTTVSEFIAAMEKNACHQKDIRANLCHIPASSDRFLCPYYRGDGVAYIRKCQFFLC